MAHLHLKHGRIITAIIAIVVVVIVANIIFRQKFESERDRERNQHLLWKWILIPVAIIVVLYLLAEQRHQKKHHHKGEKRTESGGPEYNWRGEHGRGSRSSGSFSQQQAQQMLRNLSTGGTNLL